MAIWSGEIKTESGLIISNASVDYDIENGNWEGSGYSQSDFWSSTENSDNIYSTNIGRILIDSNRRISDIGLWSIEFRGLNEPEGPFAEHIKEESRSNFSN